MKLIRFLLVAVAALCLLPGATVVQAQSAAAVVAPHDGSDGLPPVIKTLIASFDTTRDAYLTSQATLLGELKNATTDAQREQIRDALQANRNAFLAELKTFRTDLKDDLAALKSKISHEEFQRIIDAAYAFDHKASGPGAHKGH